MRPGVIRLLAAAVAVTAWSGLALQCGITYGLVGSVGRMLGVVFGYFTVTTSVLTALVFSCVAAGISRASADWLIAGVALAELLVGAVYLTLLHGLLELSGGSVVANAVLHFVLPSMVPLFWMLCTPKGGLRWWHALLWATYPLGYLLHAIEQGTRTGRYPYPFLDLRVLGWERVAANVAGIAAAFLLVASALISLDRWSGSLAKAKS